MKKKILTIMTSLLLIILTIAVYMHYSIQNKDMQSVTINYGNGDKIVIAVIGDSTTSGLGANPSPNKWKDGHSYACVNQPRHGENLQSFLVDGITPTPLYINTTGFPTQAQQDNINIPSAVRLLRSAVELKNSNSKVYNYGGCGWIAKKHIENKTVAKVAALDNKPDIIFFNLGINSAKNNKSQDSDLRILVEQALSYGIVPVLIKPNNIGVAESPSGQWKADSCPDNWYLMDNWQSIRDNIQEIANDYNLEVIDLGADNTLGDVTLLYDSFHPSNLGHKAIFNIYHSWLKKHILIRNNRHNTLIESDLLK